MKFPAGLLFISVLLICFLLVELKQTKNKNENLPVKVPSSTTRSVPSKNKNENLPVKVPSSTTRSVPSKGSKPRPTDASNRQQKKEPVKTQAVQNKEENTLKIPNQKIILFSLLAILCFACGGFYYFFSSPSHIYFDEEIMYEVVSMPIHDNSKEPFSTWINELTDTKIQSLTFRDTLTICSQRGYTVNHTPINFSSEFPLVSMHEGYTSSKAIVRKLYWSDYGATQVICVLMDSLEISQLFAGSYEKNVTVLNFADAYKPGGKIMEGSLNQEATLCRRSNLYAFLRYAKDYYFSYPLQNKKKFQALYSTEVTVFKNVDNCLLENPFVVNVLSIAFLNLSKDRTQVIENNPDHYSSYPVTPDEIKQMTRQRIRTIFQVAAEKRVCTLILGPIGCGAFNNDPHMNSQLFMEVLRDEFFGVFQNVIFADFKPSDNFTAFCTAAAQIFPNPPRYAFDSAAAIKLAKHIVACNTRTFRERLVTQGVKSSITDLNSVHPFTFQALIKDDIYDAAYKVAAKNGNYNPCYQRIKEISAL